MKTNKKLHFDEFKRPLLNLNYLAEGFIEIPRRQPDSVEIINMCCVSLLGVILNSPCAES